MKGRPVILIRMEIGSLFTVNRATTHGSTYVLYVQDCVAYQLVLSRFMIKYSVFGLQLDLTLLEDDNGN